jgi:hypothetical protein
MIGKVTDIASSSLYTTLLLLTPFCLCTILAAELEAANKALRETKWYVPWFICVMSN